jgi:O-antigen ligase
MLQKRYERTSDWLLIFSVFFISSLSSFISVIWLNPQLVFGETVSLFMLAGLSLWLSNKYNLLPKFIKSLKINWYIFPFLIFAGLSIFWSINWLISLLRWLFLVFTIIIGGYIGLRFDVKKIIGLLSGFGFYVLFLSAIIIILLPQAGIMYYYIIQGAWKGLYWHKNHMGFIAAFIAILFFFNFIETIYKKNSQAWVMGIAYIISLVFVYKSDSVGAEFTTIFLHGFILAALFWLKYKDRIQPVHYWIFTGVAVSILIIILFNLDGIFGLFNRSTSLTGRIPMWINLYNVYFTKHPVLGYGFNAFWYVDSHREIMHLISGYPDQIVISDNGFIDILINTGYIGLFLFLILYFWIFWRSIQYASKAQYLSDLFPLALMVYVTISNISWTLMFENESLFMLIMIAVLFSITKPQVSPE